TLSQDEVQQTPHHVFPVYSNPTQNSLIKRLASDTEALSKHGKATWGVKIYQRGKGKPPQDGSESQNQRFHSRIKAKATHRPLLGGTEIKRYHLNWQGGYVDYGPWLAEPRASEWFEGPRILVREVTANGIIQAVTTDDDYVFSNSVDGVRLTNSWYRLEFVLGIINSKLISFYHSYTSANAFKESFPKVLIKDLLNLPLPRLNMQDKTDKARHDRMVELVETMLKLHRDLDAARTGDEKERLRRRIEATDAQIDRLVYDLYGLSDEEIAIVEGAG
ncbi:MAG: hypothetical protein M3347_12240, partial [Armatimonadota bacterium]|nr:hypothetical protein [Armatimonadota bacterium]